MITIKKVVKAFSHDKSILNGVDLTINSGETVSVIGPSGCGKSTLLRLIIGLATINSGTIHIDSLNIADLKGKELDKLRLRFGFVFQSSALFDSMTVGDNIGFHLREHSHLPESKIKSIVAEKLKMVGLSGIENLMPAELSGGMQKRISLARAIAHNPEFILYDEPTTGLDPISSTSIEDLINKLNKELKVTAILVTHQLSTIFRCSQRICMLNEGKMLEIGSPAEARASTNPVVSNFLGGVSRD